MSFQKKEGTTFVHFESVTISKDEKEVSISSHLIREKQLRNKLKIDRLLHMSTALDAPANMPAEQPINSGGSQSSNSKVKDNSAVTQAENLKKEEKETNETILSQKDYVQKRLTEKFTDSPYNTIEEWENNDVEGYTKAYDDMIAEYPSYLRGLTKTEKQQETCCDLLENSYICSIANNYADFYRNNT